MARKDITDIQVLRAYDMLAIGLTNKWPYETLMEETGQSEKVCFRAMERAEDHGLIECGVSLRSGWITKKGKEMLLADYMESSYEDQAIRTLEQAIQWKFPKIKGLTITSGEGNKFNITFNDDGIHTQEMINNHLTELKQFAK